MGTTRPWRKKTVVRESSLQRDGLFGGLAALFVVALVRGARGAHTTAGTVVGAVVFGLLLLGVLAAWRAVRRQATRLEITSVGITLRHSKGEVRVIDRASGDALHFGAQSTGRASYLILAGGGDGPPLELQFFSRRKVKAACLAHGWQFPSWRPGATEST